MESSQWVHALKAALGEGRVETSPEALAGVSRDRTENTPGAAQAWVKVDDAAQVQRVLALAREHRVPVTPRVAGMNVGGLTNPTAGGIVLDLSAMNRVLHVDRAQMYALIEPGVTWASLTEHLRAHNHPLRLGYPLAPPDTSVMACCLMDGLSTLSLPYGSMGQWIQGLEVALMSGELVRTGAAAVSDAWFARGPLPDLTGLFLNWQGTTGVVTKMAFSLWPAPALQRRRVVLCRERDAGFSLMRNLSYTRLFDEVGGLSWPAAKMALGVEHPRLLPGEPEFFLVVDVSAGSPRELALKLTLLEEEIQELRREGRGIEASIDAEDLIAIEPVFARFARLPARLDFLLDHPGEGLTWVGTFGPIDRLEEGAAAGVEILTRLGYPPIIVSRPMWGGHYAVLRFIEVFDLKDAQDVERVGRCQDEVALALLERGFVPYKCSPRVWQQVGARMDPGARALMQRVKATMDPHGLLNPGKLGL